ncbi:MAG: hypothetical protein ABFE07_02035 [Armatimonadia bacterium]
MAYVHFTRRLYAQIDTALRAQFSEELLEIDAAPLPDAAFQIGDPTAFMGEAVALMYVGTKREREAAYWVETAYSYELHLFALGVDTQDVQYRMMDLEYAARQVLDSNKTMGGLLRTLVTGDSEPVAFNLTPGQMIGGIGFPFVCQPATRIAIPEHTP